MGQVSAVEMAKAAGIDPKRFRQALRDEEFDWHIHGASWTVNRGGPDHLDMERVLRRLVPDSPTILWSRRSWTTSAFWVGADPGGKDAFGLAFLDASGGLNCTTVSSVDEATGRIIQQGEPLALGIDAPMWWSSGKGGGRRADELLRKRYGIPSGTVQSVNSLRGAVLVGGTMLAFRVRREFRSTRITESHPKALLRALALDGSGFAKNFGIPSAWSNEHERDAAIAAVCAKEGFEGRWTTDLASHRYDSEQDPKRYWLRPMCYFWPEAL